MSRFSILFLVSILLAGATPALAQVDGGSFPAVDGGSGLNPDLANIINTNGEHSVAAIGAFGKDLVAASHSSNKLLFVMLLIIALVAGVRLGGAPMAQAFGWKTVAAALTSDRGGAIITLVLAVLGSLASGMMTGTGFSFSLFSVGLLAGFSSIGGYVGFRKIFGISSTPAGL